MHPRENRNGKAMKAVKSAIHVVLVYLIPLRNHMQCSSRLQRNCEWKQRQLRISHGSHRATTTTSPARPHLSWTLHRWATSKQWNSTKKSSTWETDALVSLRACPWPMSYSLWPATTSFTSRGAEPAKMPDMGKTVHGTWTPPRLAKISTKLTFYIKKCHVHFC